MTRESAGKEEYIFIAGLTKLIRPKMVLEVGTAQGYGSLALMESMLQGSLLTVDIVDQRCQELCDYCGPVKITFEKKDSAVLLADLVREGQRFDLVFIDGDHHYKQVLADWKAAKHLSDILVFHDAMHFQGVARVIDHIRKDSQWDVVVMDYPGITLIDRHNRPYVSNRRPGLAIATLRRNPRLPDLKNLPGTPTPSSRKAVARWRGKFSNWLSADTPTDLNHHDLSIILHLLWEFRPSLICQAGHVGTAATFLFKEYAHRKKIPFLAWDVSEKFTATKISRLPHDFTIQLPEVLMSKDHSQIFSALKKSKTLLWIDAWEPADFYVKIAPELLEIMHPDSLACIRNFSPHDGHPEIPQLQGAQCTNPQALSLLNHLCTKKGIICRLARPELVFDDYVNAGHWLYVSKR